MASGTMRRRVFGWMMFDWASQPYNTLLLTFIFGPYFAEIFSDRMIAAGVDETQANACAQSVWAWSVAIAGIFIAILSPFLGALADRTRRRLPYIWGFSLLYVIGATGLWFAIPGGFNLTLVLGFFILGLIGMEFATTFTNAMLPSLGDRSTIGRISGSGFSMGYIGGFVALVVALLFLAENPEGKTLIGISPVFGLDAEAREGTRFVGIFTALWYALFMIPFFLWVRDLDRPAVSESLSVREASRDVVDTLARLPRNQSLFAFLISSMSYRDALAGFYTFGGVFAAGVMGWSVVDVGIFGILAVIAGAFFAWIGGKADSRFGPKPVIGVTILMLILAGLGMISISPATAFGFSLPENDVFAGQRPADLAFYLCGVVIGGAGGVLQSASRTMLVRQANPERMTEAFGLYALAGKSTSFLVPALIGLVTAMTGSQQLGGIPVIVFFIIGLVLLLWVKSEGAKSPEWISQDA